MTNGNDELSDDAKGRGATVRDGAGWCGTALDGTTRRKRAQPGATGRRGRKRAQPGATGRNRAQKGGLVALQTL